MPNLTLAIEDTSPLLAFSSDWVPGSSKTDNLTELYSDASYMATNTKGGSVFFVFTGTNVGFFGAKRSTHGFYQISVDSKVYTPVNGESNDPGLFQASLFSSITLANTAHTVELSNANDGLFVDLDYVTWTAKVGRDDEELIVNTYQDSDLPFKYTPTDAWTTDPGNLGTFSGASGHVTSKPGSTVEFTFEGDGISLFGPVSPNGAPYSVSVNVGNGLPNNYTTKKTFFRPNMMLYHANTLGPGSHTVTLTVLDGGDPSGQSSALAIDYAQVYTAPSLGGRNIASGNGSLGLTPGAAAGVTLAAVLAVIALIAITVWGIFFYIRKTQNRTFFYGFVQSKDDAGKDITSVRPFVPYATVSQGSPPPPNQPALASISPFNTLATTPNTGQWPLTGGQGSTNDSSHPLINQPSFSNSLTQEIIIPQGSEKYRPDRIPQLQPPPQSSKQRNTLAAAGGSTQNISPISEETSAPRPTRVNTELEEPSAPPPEYSQQPIEAEGSQAAAMRVSGVPSTASSSFYAREAWR